MLEFPGLAVSVHRGPLLAGCQPRQRATQESVLASTRTTNAPSQWNVQPARFKTTGTPGRIDDREVAKPILIEVLRDLHRNAFASQVAESERNQIFADAPNWLDKIVAFREAQQMAGVEKESVTR